MIYTNSKTVVAIDPSFNNTGICIVNKDAISYKKFSCSVQKKTFKNMLLASDSISSWIFKTVSSVSPDILIVETPPPVMRFSAGLWMLCNSVVLKLKDDFEVLLSPPAIGRRIFKTRKWDKNFSLMKAKSVNPFASNITHDEADAFIMTIPFLTEEVKLALSIVTDDVTYDKLAL